MERLYLCDPDKNRDCTKRACKFNPLSVHPRCEATRNPDFAVLNEKGDPVLAPALYEKFFPDERTRRALEMDAEKSDYDRCGRTYAMGVVKAIVKQTDITDREKILLLEYFIDCLDKRLKM